ncbi:MULTISPECIES: DUF484 family protein [unclassified Herbaspirillum]|uniref:DUF484 family protein n=1 Tax=unclassified Herbaspirillum TaxID=2624150 RepID=UPI00114D5242|nr:MULTISPECIES: DUF484 family protein [unclassified Herbaspirillum]MBB5390229.1 hypothetical protein [Herbaspirillum sp. SJZ102]TQK09273.1 hypothetical protein FB599_1635 [Herbaspirillum sp. SJZ130]TQK14040.1 hypothetical protein FB598_1407 [Herbaspirillum sp. SJZ106]TWC69739.1 hypothetical protein FB597_102344 [Herbaspirillum sp. SJZ099]
MTTQLDSDLIAEYLLDHPGFFEEHAELLSRIKLTSPVMGRAVSLQERQMEILREKIKVQELHMADLMRIAQENDEITNKFQAWTRALLLARNETDLPHTLADQLKEIFHVPQVTLRLWNLPETHAAQWFTQSVSEDARIFANGLSAPFCGPNKDFEAASWLEDAASVKSVAILPLRGGASPDSFGLLVLGSGDPNRFTAEMGTDFLTRIGETASAALACLLR